MIEGECNSMKHESNKPYLKERDWLSWGWSAQTAGEWGKPTCHSLLPLPVSLRPVTKMLKRMVLKWEITKVRNPEHWVSRTSRLPVAPPSFVATCHKNVEKNGVKMGNHESPKSWTLSFTNFETTVVVKNIRSVSHVRDRKRVAGFC